MRGGLQLTGFGFFEAPRPIETKKEDVVEAAEIERLMAEMQLARANASEVTAASTENNIA